MAWTPARQPHQGQIVTAADMNGGWTLKVFRDGDVLWAADLNGMSQQLAKVSEAQAAPGLTALAVTAALASASQAPISRRRLLRFWKR